MRGAVWAELLRFLDGTMVEGGEGELPTRGILFVGVLRLPRSQTVCSSEVLLELGLPQAVLARMPLKLFLPDPTANDLVALLTDQCCPWLAELGVSQSARSFLAERAAASGFGAWGIQHELRELDLLVAERRPKRVDRGYLERHLG
ncbi:MAG: hypothetical protein AB7S38_11340 [Vulcanimicrobiota bacterium]